MSVATYTRQPSNGTDYSLPSYEESIRNNCGTPPPVYVSFPSDQRSNDARGSYACAEQRRTQTQTQCRQANKEIEEDSFLCFIFFKAIPSFQLMVGGRFLYECSASIYLPYWLIATAFILLLAKHHTLVWISELVARPFTYNSFLCAVLYTCVFGFWAIAGYLTAWNMFDSSTSLMCKYWRKCPECPSPLIRTAFWTYVGYAMLYSSHLIFSLCGCCCEDCENFDDPPIELLPR